MFKLSFRQKMITMYSLLVLVTLGLVAAGTVTLAEGLAWLLSGGGAGIVTYFLIDKVPFLAKLEPDYKRYVSIALVVVLAAAGWGISMAMGYSPVPETWRAWIETAFSIMFVALTTSLVIHGGRDLRQKRLNGK